MFWHNSFLKENIKGVVNYTCGFFSCGKKISEGDEMAKKCSGHNFNKICKSNNNSLNKKERKLQKKKLTISGETQKVLDSVNLKTFGN